MDITNIITTVGYPIASAIILFLGLKYVYDKERASLEKTIDKIEHLTIAVEKNSEAIRELANEICNNKEEWLLWVIQV